jgi:hypothetical protein
MPLSAVGKNRSLLKHKLGFIGGVEGYEISNLVLVGREAKYFLLF